MHEIFLLPFNFTTPFKSVGFENPHDIAGATDAVRIYTGFPYASPRQYTLLSESLALVVKAVVFSVYIKREAERMIAEFTAVTISIDLAAGAPHAIGDYGFNGRSKMLKFCKNAPDLWRDKLTDLKFRQACNRDFFLILLAHRATSRSVTRLWR